MKEEAMSERREFVVVAWAEPASGPGWANRPIRAVVQELGGGQMRQVWIQPEEQTDAMHTLYAVNATATGQMTKLVAAKLGLSQP